MSKICCVDDTRVPVKPNYVSLYKWPEPEAERVGGARRLSRVVDSVSCRQMYLRSYTFSRKETVPERTMKCLARVREKVGAASSRRKEDGEALRRRRWRRRRRGLRRRVVVLRRVRKFSRDVLSRIFRRLLFCSASIDVVDQN